MNISSLLFVFTLEIANINKLTETDIFVFNKLVVNPKSEMHFHFSLIIAGSVATFPPSDHSFGGFSFGSEVVEWEIWPFGCITNYDACNTVHSTQHIAHTNGKYFILSFFQVRVLFAQRWVPNCLGAIIQFVVQQTTGIQRRWDPCMKHHNLKTHIHTWCTMHTDTHTQTQTGLCSGPTYPIHLDFATNFSLSLHSEEILSQFLID